MSYKCSACILGFNLWKEQSAKWCLKNGNCRKIMWKVIQRLTQGSPCCLDSPKAILILFSLFRGEFFISRTVICALLVALTVLYYFSLCTMLSFYFVFIISTQCLFCFIQLFKEGILGGTSSARDNASLLENQELIFPSLLQIHWWC